MPGGWGDFGKGAAAGAAIGNWVPIPGLGPVLGAGIGGLTGWLFGGGDDDKKKKENPEDPYTLQLQGSADRLRGEASDLTGAGGDVINPVAKYLKDVLGDNPSAIMDATRSDRGRVMDQYDTARQTIAQFGQRGGGTTSALAKSQFTEGETLADLTSDKRSEAMQMGAGFGSSLTGLGLSAEQLSNASLEQIIDAIMTREGFDVAKRGQNMAALGDLGQAAGSILGGVLGGK